MMLTAIVDLVFNGGKYGISVGNQQFTVRNITVNNANVAINGLWNWGEQNSPYS
jgi:glucan 1,3-beta-glucosidase